MRSQQTLSPLISPLDLNKGRWLTNCCLETQPDASEMGFIQKPARPSSDLRCPLCRPLQSYGCKWAKELKAFAFVLVSFYQR